MFPLANYKERLWGKKQTGIQQGKMKKSISQSTLWPDFSSSPIIAKHCFRQLNSHFSFVTCFYRATRRSSRPAGSGHIIACANVKLWIKKVQEHLGWIHRNRGEQIHALFFRPLSRGSLGGHWRVVLGFFKFSIWLEQILLNFLGFKSRVVMWLKIK